MKRYLVMETAWCEPDHRIIEAESPEAALAAWDAVSDFYRAEGAIVAEVKLEAEGGR